MLVQEYTYKILSMKNLKMIDLQGKKLLAMGLLTSQPRCLIIVVLEQILSIMSRIQHLINKGN